MGRDNKIPLLARRELTISFELAQVQRICTLLDQHGIDFMVRRAGHRTDPQLAGVRNGTGRASFTGRAGQEYIVYVHKQKLDAARALIGR